MSGASSLRNATKRITHKERSQPSSRKKLGLLEKHKDYVIRAKDYHKKQDYLNVLKKKAADKNPDEFYFHMNNSQVSKGIHKDKKDGSLDMSIVKLLKTQDMGYIVHRKSIDDKKIEKIKNNIHLIGDTKPKTHKIFVDDNEKVLNFDPVKHFNTSPELINHSHNRLRIDTIENHIASDSLKTLSKKENIKLLKKKEKTLKELEGRIKRTETLKKTMDKLQTQKNLMGQGTKRKIIFDEDGKIVKKQNRNNNEDDNNNNNDDDDSRLTVIYKWKRDRKR
jgi:U3 small nucleolar RNA-associated protein 11